jgi:hypothetical protein
MMLDGAYIGGRNGKGRGFRPEMVRLAKEKGGPSPGRPDLIALLKQPFT